jgi:hypothetical protein
MKTYPAELTTKTDYSLAGGGDIIISIDVYELVDEDAPYSRHNRRFLTYAEEVIYIDAFTAELAEFQYDIEKPNKQTVVAILTDTGFKAIESGTGEAVSLRGFLQPYMQRAVDRVERIHAKADADDGAKRKLLEAAYAAEKEAKKEAEAAKKEAEAAKETCK